MLRSIHRTRPFLPASARPPILRRTITCTPHICRGERAEEVLAKPSKLHGGIWHKTNPNDLGTASRALAQIKKLQKSTQDPASKDTSALEQPEVLGQDALEWAHKVLHSRLSMFRLNRSIKVKASSMGIRGNLFAEMASLFTKSALVGDVQGCDAQSVLQLWDDDLGIERIDRMLLTAFFQFSEPQLPPEILSQFSALRKLSNLKFPNEWFPEARQMQRKIHLHIGPTNSGKTHAALTRLASASAGIYCGPLRLLAHEIYERMNARGIPCNLLTGEQRIEVSPTAPLISSTVEMAVLNRDLDVAVVDEIQVIADRSRGWAWTQALLGLRARELHLCGEASAVPLVMNIAQTLGEEVEVHEYQRLTPLVVANKSLGGSFKNVKKGDCMVTFSRRNIFAAKQKVEQSTGLKCAVVYGSLPPETRALQAKLFNNPENDFDVLVASDAIGMGLNLNIKRIIFETVYKYDGKNFRRITAPHLKQIAGRAGRFGTQFEAGEATTFDNADLVYLKQAMEAPVEELEMAGLQPTVEILEQFSAQLPGEPFSALLQKFEDFASLGGLYFLCNYRDQKVIAELIEHLPLSLRDRNVFVTGPVSTKEHVSTDALLNFATHYANGKQCLLNDMVRLPRMAPTKPEQLKDLECKHKVIMLYMWLAMRFPDSFISDPEDCNLLKERTEHMIDEALRNVQLQTARRLNAAARPPRKAEFEGSKPGVHAGREWVEKKKKNATGWKGTKDVDMGLTGLMKGKDNRRWEIEKDGERKERDWERGKGKEKAGWEERPGDERSERREANF